MSPLLVTAQLKAPKEGPASSLGQGGLGNELTHPFCLPALFTQPAAPPLLLGARLCASSGGAVVYEREPLPSGAHGLEGEKVPPLRRGEAGSKLWGGGKRLWPVGS